MCLELNDAQMDAIEKLKNGSILCGEVGTGKTRTSLGYFYFKVCGGSAPINGNGEWKLMKSPMDLYIITTAKKRDSGDWESEALMFRIYSDPDLNQGGNSITVDSWNNINKYKKVKGSFFIFDEQRVKGKGPWVKAFLEISKNNKWILCSATPGDTWVDYIPVFLANGFYRNRTEFNERHCVFNRFVKWPQIDGYINEGLLLKHKTDIMVPMHVVKNTVPHRMTMLCEYKKEDYLRVSRDRWDIFKNIPIDSASRLCYLLRKVVNDTDSRSEAVLRIFKLHPKLIVFYNYNYELDRLEKLFTKEGIVYSQWNGKKHEAIPEGDSWVYLVQYMAGCEGWNCITTDAICFYSMTYSYSQQIQAEGRIDRYNTPFINLYYYFLKTTSPIDLAIQRSIKKKENFNELKFLGVKNDKLK